MERKKTNFLSPGFPVLYVFTHGYMKSLFLLQLMSMGDKIGYPPYIMDSQALELEYDGVSFM